MCQLSEICKVGFWKNCLGCLLKRVLNAFTPYHGIAHFSVIPHKNWLAKPVIMVSLHRWFYQTGNISTKCTDFDRQKESGSLRFCSTIESWTGWQIETMNLCSMKSIWSSPWFLVFSEMDLMARYHKQSYVLIMLSIFQRLLYKNSVDFLTVLPILLIWQMHQRRS